MSEEFVQFVVMNQRALVLMCMLIVAVAPGCRSRKTPPPQAAPSAPASPAMTQPAVPVSPPADDFRSAQPQANDDVLTGDLQELNRQARQRGWIQDAFFAFDATTLDDDAQEALRQSATWLRSRPEYRIRVEGHCDERGTEQYNLALGERRAEAAASYLATLGVERRRISTVSYGEERPFEEGSNEAAWAQNRRAHLVLER